MQYRIEVETPLFHVSVTSPAKNIKNEIKLTSSLHRVTTDSQSSVEHKIIVSNAMTIGRKRLLPRVFEGSFDWLIIADSKPGHLSLKEAIVQMLLDHTESLSVESPQKEMRPKTHSELRLHALEAEASKQVAHKKENLEVEILPLFPTESSGDKVSIQEVRNHMYQSLRRVSGDIASDTNKLIEEYPVSS